MSKDLDIITYKSDIFIPKGEVLKHNVKYYRYGAPTNLQTNQLRADLSPYGTQNIKLANTFTGEWDGIIPSGAFVRIETASTDGKFLGFDGTISVVQESGDGSPKIAVSCTGSFEGVGIDAKYQYSVNKAFSAAKRKYYRKLNNILIANGAKNKNSKMRRYERMMERVATNIYDGLALTRNEKVGMAQGIEANPIGSPIYYDGVSNAYGGSRDSSNYNYVDIVLDKMTSPVSNLLFAPTGIFAGSISPSTSNTSSSAGGGATY
jgi:hypothetical protein